MKNYWLVVGGILVGVGFGYITQSQDAIDEDKKNEKLKEALFYGAAGAIVVAIGLKGFDK